MFGRHYRADPERAEPLFFLMRDVPLRYRQGARAVSVPAAVIARAIANSLQALEGKCHSYQHVLLC